MKRIVDYMINGQDERYSSPAPVLFKKIRKVSDYLAGIVLLTGIPVLIGWQLDISVLKRPFLQLAAMNPVTAVLFVFSSFSFFFLSSRAMSTKKRIVGKTLSVLVILLNQPSM